MRKCKYCPAEGFDTTGARDPDKIDMCRPCWYSGRVLAENLAGVIEVLRVATGTDWIAEHTGGGCWWIATYFGDPELDAKICVTRADDVLSGTDTVHAVEEAGGWCVGMYLHDLDEGRFESPVGTEMLPKIVREMGDMLKEAVPS